MSPEKTNFEEKNLENNPSTAVALAQNNLTLGDNLTCAKSARTKNKNMTRLNKAKGLTLLQKIDKIRKHLTRFDFY